MTRAYLAAAFLCFLGYVLVPSETAKGVLYVGIGLLCVAATATGIRMHRPGRPVVWWSVLAGMVFWAIAGVLQNIEGLQPSDTAAALPDVLFLVGYAVFAASLLLLVGGRDLRRDVAGALESAMVTGGLALLAWVFIGRPTLETWHAQSFATVVSLAYPAMDILLIGGLVRMIMTPGARTVAYRLVLVAVAVLVGADLTVAVALVLGADAGYVHIAYFGCYVIWGAAALHPSMATVTTPGRSSNRLTRRRMATLGLACVVAPGVLAVQVVSGRRIDVWAIVIGSVVMSGLVMARMAVAIRAITAAQRERERLQADLLFQASHDPLTGLPNRGQAVEAIAGALARAQRGGYLVGLLFVDLDGFKSVNDNFGHAAGDEVLRATARRLQDQVRTGDLVARLGGDEFVVVLEQFDSERDALEIAQRVVDGATEPITTSRGAGMRIGASVGMAIAQDGSLDPDRLLQEADAAVYRAKHAGRGRVEVFGDGLRRELAERSRFDDALIHAIDHDELVVHYQPIVDAQTLRVRGYEALVRWERPGHGLLAPGAFVPAAERSMLVCDLDMWVMRTACRQLSEWTRDNAAGFDVAVNLSGRYLSAPRIVDDVRKALADAGLAPDRLVLEITETTVLEDVLALDHLRQLRDLGVAISLDDFGTGYASIALLRHLPVDIIKIDRSYLEADAASLSLLRLMIEAAHSFGLPVVAEGVEHAEQLDLLRELDCESVQGFHLARPLPADELALEPAASVPAGSAQLLGGNADLR